MYSQLLLKRQYLSLLVSILCVIMIVGVTVRPISSATRALNVHLDLNGLAGEGELSRVTRPPVAATVAAFNALQARASGQLDVYWDRSMGTATFLDAHDSTGRIPYKALPSDTG